jgi:GDP-4-dehydro-6-deoxy-D-mannose reductase
MKKIAVTGANGFVGQHLINELAAHDYEVIAVGGTNLPAVAHSQANITRLTIDLTDPEAVKTIDFSGVDAVLHLAGLAAVGPSFDAPMKYITANIGMEVNLFEAAILQKCFPRFLVISSGSLYDTRAELPITELSPVAPSSPYAASKLGQEQMAQYYSRRGFECIIARPFNHIGPGQGPGFIVPDIAQQLIQVERKAAAVIKVGNLDAQRDYTDVRDIVRAYRLLMEKGNNGEIYNICSGTPRSGNEILKSLIQASGVAAETEQDPAKMRPADTPKIYGDHSKIRDHTGWQPEIALETTLTDVINDWRTR